MKRAVIIFLALLVTFAVFSSCSTKKKSLDIQKEHIEQSSKVKKEEHLVKVDSSTFESSSKEKNRVKVVEEWFATDTNVAHKTPYYRKTTYSNEVKTAQSKQQNSILVNQSSKVDSAGKLQSESKSKVQNKEIKESVSSKIWGTAFLLIAVLVSIWYVKRQIKAG